MLGFIPHTRTASRIEHAQQTQLTFTRVLDAMYLSVGQINTRAGRDGRAGFAGPHAAFAPENEEHFFVIVKMIRRPAGRNRTDKLSCVNASNPVVHDHSIPAIGGRLCALIGQTNNRRRRAGGEMSRRWRNKLRRTIRIGTLRTDDGDGLRTRIIDGKRLAGTNVDARVRIDLIGFSLDQKIDPPATAGGTDFIADGTSALRAIQHVQNLIAIIVTNRRRQTGQKFHDAQRNCLSSSRASNLVPNAQRSFDYRRAIAHMRNTTTTFQHYSHNNWTESASATNSKLQ